MFYAHEARFKTRLSLRANCVFAHGARQLKVFSHGPRPIIGSPIKKVTMRHGTTISQTTKFEFAHKYQNFSDVGTLL